MCFKGGDWLLLRTPGLDGQLSPGALYVQGLGVVTQPLLPQVLLPLCTCALIAFIPIILTSAPQKPP